MVRRISRGSIIPNWFFPRSTNSSTAAGRPQRRNLHLRRENKRLRSPHVWCVCNGPRVYPSFRRLPHYCALLKRAVFAFERTVSARGTAAILLGVSKLFLRNISIACFLCESRRV